MNERIKELAKQATVSGYFLGTQYVNSSLDEEKFAELIAAECVNMIEEAAKNADEDDVHGMRNAAGLISRTFITFK